MIKSDKYIQTELLIKIWQNGVCCHGGCEKKYWLYSANHLPVLITMFKVNVVLYDVNNKITTVVSDPKNRRTKANRSTVKQKISRGYFPPDNVIVEPPFKEKIAMLNYDWNL